ncbi:MAG: type II toxin-antitoxin system VapC family toxin [Lachnospiraceae bacterium]|nr:type II toxin-antitoxin system VapC family toxin [Lachnospiraceae bacterium]
MENNTVFYSIASVWETEIKNSLGKLPISGQQLSEYCRETGFKLLSVEEKHIFALNSLERDLSLPKHNDPFDRIMLAQAKVEGYNFITHDSLVAGYNEKCIVFV